MMTVQQVSRLTGVSVRALQYYDQIGLLPPAGRTAAGYRLYDDAALERLQQVLLFRELEFPLKEIRRIMDSPAFDRKRALRQQIELLTLKKERLDNLIALARNVLKSGGNAMDFQAFDTRKLDAYSAQAKAAWGQTDAYRQYEEKQLSDEEKQQAADGVMACIAAIGQARDQGPASPAAQDAIKALQEFITAHFYDCTLPILRGLGQMYGGGGEFTENIDAACGAGTAKFAAEAIARYTAGKA